AMNEDMVKVLALPKGTELRYRGDLKVRPMASLLLTDGTKWLREGTLPIIVTNHAENHRIGMLRECEATDKPTRAETTVDQLTEDERYLTCLPVYRAKDT